MVQSQTQCRCRMATNMCFFVVFVTSKSNSATYSMQCAHPSNMSNTPF